MVVQKPIDNVIDKKNNVKKTDIQEKEQAVQTVFSAQHAPADLKEQVPPVALYKDVDSDDMTKNTVPFENEVSLVEKDDCEQKHEVSPQEDDIV